MKAKLLRLLPLLMAVALIISAVTDLNIGNTPCVKADDTVIKKWEGEELYAFFTAGTGGGGSQADGKLIINQTATVGGGNRWIAQAVNAGSAYFPTVSGAEYTVVVSIKFTNVIGEGDSWLRNCSTFGGQASDGGIGDILVNYSNATVDSWYDVTYTFTGNGQNYYLALTCAASTVLYRTTEINKIVVYGPEAEDEIPPVPGESGTITPNNVKDHSLTLNWTKAADDITEAADLKYYVYQKSSAFTISNGLPSDGTLLNTGGTLDIASYVVSGLAADTEYYFIVVAEDEAGNKAAYTSVSIATAEEGEEIPLKVWEGEDLYDFFTAPGTNGGSQEDGMLIIDGAAVTAGRNNRWIARADLGSGANFATVNGEQYTVVITIKFSEITGSGGEWLSNSPGFGTAPGDINVYTSLVNSSNAVRDDWYEFTFTFTGTGQDYYLGLASRGSTDNYRKTEIKKIVVYGLEGDPGQEPWKPEHGEASEVLEREITNKIAEKANPDKFSFAVIGDPQVVSVPGTFLTSLDALSSSNNRDQKSASSLKQAITEINQMDPKPDFTMFSGDIVDSPNNSQFGTFKNLISHTEIPILNTHGNHDGPVSAASIYHDQMPDVMGFSDMLYSFDAGQWHIISFPWLQTSGAAAGPAGTAGENTRNPNFNYLKTWLAADLEANKTKNTIIFGHAHLMPQGLSQLEWYTLPLQDRLDLMEIMEKWGNVKYYINGHTHNGIKSSVKMMHEYHGIVHITAPTVVISRQFEEEYEGFPLNASGFYMMVEIDGNDIKINGRQAYNENEYEYPLNSVPEFTDEMEPRWTKTVWQLPAKSSLENGGFENIINGAPSGWNSKYRYKQDVNPAFQYNIVTDKKASGNNAAQLHVRAVTPEIWARDEHVEYYQVIDVTPGAANITLDAKYYLEKIEPRGGGYISVIGLTDSGTLASSASNSALGFVMMFKWGTASAELTTEHLSSAYNYQINGTGVGAPIGYLGKLATEYKGMYYNINAALNQWNTLSVDLKSIYDASHMEAGAFDKLGVTKIVVAIGVYVNVYSAGADNVSQAWFDDISITEKSTAGGYLNNGASIVIDGSEYNTLYGCARRNDSNLNDRMPPMPLIPTWKIVPEINGTIATMTAATAIDPSGVEYYFEEYIGDASTPSRNSGWQTSPIWTVSGIQDGKEYSYRYQTRDRWDVSIYAPDSPNIAAPVPNVGAWSVKTEKISIGSADKYVITFNTNGGSPIPQIQNLSDGQKVSKPAQNPQKTGYTFKYWALTGTSTEYDFNSTVNKSITLTAVYEINKYTVTFNSGDTSSPNTIQTIEYGAKLSKPADPAKEGYNFAGWYNGNDLWDFNTMTVSGNVTLIPRWNEASNPSNQTDPSNTLDPSYQPDPSVPDTSDVNTSIALFTAGASALAGYKLKKKEKQKKR